MCNKTAFIPKLLDLPLSSEKMFVQTFFLGNAIQ